MNIFAVSDVAKGGRSRGIQPWALAVAAYQHTLQYRK